MEAVKVMIHDHDLSMHLWTEAASTIVYVHNKISHNALGNKTPKEMFTSEKSKLNHMKLLGFPVYILVPK